MDYKDKWYFAQGMFIACIYSIIIMAHTALVSFRLFVEILQKTSDMNEIQFHEDGSWSPLKAFKEPHVISCSPAAHKSSQSESRPSASSSSPSSSGTNFWIEWCLQFFQFMGFINFCRHKILWCRISFRDIQFCLYE